MPGGDILGINRFIREVRADNKWVGEVYDLRREANEIYTGVRALVSPSREAARELMTENRKLLSVRRSVVPAGRQPVQDYQAD